MFGAPRKGPAFDRPPNGQARLDGLGFFTPRFRSLLPGLRGTVESDGRSMARAALLPSGFPGVDRVDGKGRFIFLDLPTEGLFPVQGVVRLEENYPLGFPS